ncbi:MAG TPA: cupredoxin family copper-binding protein [Solirubrobacterales bacterium]|nr:cupredoxin family copper-binding protein [Solirubrobacterales bacterium]
MKLKASLAPALLVLVFSLAACGDDGDSDTATETQTATETTETTSAPSGNAPAPSGEAVRSAKVEIVDFAYDPDPVTIQTGGKVIWINRDAEPHTATADDESFDTGTLEEGKLKSESFKEPGSYPYVCEIHPTMQGTVEVVDQE